MEIEIMIGVFVTVMVATTAGSAYWFAGVKHD